MGNYVLDLLEKDDLVPWLEDPKFNASVLQLAYEAFVEFVTPTCGPEGVQTSGCDKVYVPGSLSDCGQFCAIAAARVRRLPGGLLQELLRQVPRRGLRRRLLPGRERRVRQDKGQLLLWTSVLDHGVHAAVPRRDRWSQRPKGAVQLLTAPGPARRPQQARGSDAIWRVHGRLLPPSPNVHSDY